MAKTHVMTPKRRAALKKAQKESALKRRHGKHYAPRGSSRRKTIRRNRKWGRRAAMVYNGVQLAAGAAAIGYGLHDIHKSQKKIHADNQARKRGHESVHKSRSSGLSGHVPKRHGKGRTSGPPRSTHAYVHVVRSRFKRASGR